MGVGIDWKTSVLVQCKSAPVGQHQAGRGLWMNTGTVLLFFYVFESVRNTFNTFKKYFSNFFFYLRKGFCGISHMSFLFAFVGNFLAVTLANGGQ